MIKSVVSLICGTLFGFGLALSQMINPEKIQGFLDIFGVWDPSLLLVMAGALLVTMLTFRLVLKRPAPLLESQFFLSTRRQVDRPLLIGATLFGIGWGLSGYCPGPAVAGLSLMTWDPLVVLVSILAGFICQKMLADYLSRRRKV